MVGGGNTTLSRLLGLCHTPNVGSWRQLGSPYTVLVLEITTTQNAEEIEQCVVLLAISTPDADAGGIAKNGDLIATLVAASSRNSE